MDKFTKADVEKLIYRACELCGFEVYEQNIQLRKGSAVITVRIDNGSIVSHEDCVKYTAKLNSLIEDSGIEDSYTLEISSPGLKRKIRSKAEFVRFSGAPVKIILGGEKGGAVKGKIVSAGDESVVLKTEKGMEEISYNDIKNSNLDY
ncbi:MAG TPA: hypothetical protein PK624_10810 [Spirochaetota bacterium]|nr:hypothetical protein [Spirochaetota bacterium]HOR45274.1 hypothetical protein [Spirochaetota bacterium]HOU85204.1 hypothetical protein [Spirochaetota bacterium]HPK55490.1 hypothetical protein [Spirochaetota bacterium]HQE58928.1 hypothetical protein [Spirochaetota bacterium]